MATETHKEILNSRRPHFLEAFHPDSSSERLKIPLKFMKNLEGKTCGLVSLVGPSGSTWQVDLVQQNGSLFFCDGWPEFVIDHFIACDDTLVFRYDGNLQFTVQVFDHTGCEKEAAFNAGCKQEPPSNADENMGRKRDRDQEGALFDKIVEGEPKKMRMTSECISKDKGAENFQEPISTVEYCGSPSKNPDIPIKAKPLTPIEATQRRRSSTQNEQSSSGIGCRSKLSRSEEKVAQSFTSCFPHFVRIMKQFNISGSYTLKIPYKFSTAHLPKCKIKVILHNLKGECWTVNSIPTTRVHTGHTFCGGWMAFVRGNDIKMGDICIFELVRKCELRVHILGDGGKGLKQLSGKGATDSGYRATTNKSLEAIPKKMNGKSRKVQLECVSKVCLSDKKSSKARKEAVFSNERKKRGNVSKGSSNYSLCSQSKACNEKAKKATKSGSRTKVEPTEEEKVAQTFNSSFPSFVRIMKKFNTSGSYTLNVPHKFSVAHLPNCKTEIVLRNSKGECWTVNSVPASKGLTVLHTFCGGWMGFIRENNVKLGDICIFELVGKGEMLVHITEASKESGHQNGNAAVTELQGGSSTCNGSSS